MSLCFKIDHYFFLELGFKANESFDFNKDAEQVKVEQNYSLHINESDRKVAMADFTFQSSDDATGNFPYHFKIQMIAFFSKNDDEAFDQADIRTPVDVAQILYGIAREAVCNMTSRGPYPAFIAPAIQINGKKAQSKVEVKVKK